MMGAAGPAGFGQVQEQKIGIFGKIPCPHCGAETTSSSPGTGTAQAVGGVFLLLIIKAFTNSYYCATHGKIAMADFPAQNRTMIYTRKGLMFGSAFLILFFVLILLVAVEIFI